MRFLKIFLASMLVAMAATIAFAASNKRKKETKCNCAVVEECTGHADPSADGPGSVADCEGFTFSISNLVGVVEQMHKVNRWTGDGDCPEDVILDEWKQNGSEPTAEWTISSGGQSASGTGTEAHIDAGDSDSANCTFTLKSNAPHCGTEFTATLSASAQFTNNVTVTGGDICCTSSSHPSHIFTWEIECGNAKSVSASGASIISQGANYARLQGAGPTASGSLTVEARGGTGTVGFKVFDVGELELTGGCGCFPNCSETMEGFDVSAIQHRLPSGLGSVKKEGTTFTGWFDCNGNGIPDADEPHKTRSYTIVKRPSLRIASDNDAGGAKNEGFAPGTKLILEVDGDAGGTPHIEIVSMEAKEKGTSMKAGEIVSNGNSCEMTIPPDCPAGTITFEVTFSRHRCISEQTTITVAGCSCSTCEQSGDMSCENGCIDISLGLGRTETGGAKSRIHIRQDDPSIMPEIASRTFPDGRLESFVTNGVRHLEFYDTTNDTPHVSYELTPGENTFTVLEKRNGTPRRFTRWMKSGDEWIMEIYDPSVSPMELVERVAKTETATSGGKVVRETNGIVSIEQEYRRLSDGDMFLVRETRGTGANALTTWHAPVQSGDGAGQTRSTVNPDGSWIIYTYDSEGRVLTETESFGDTAPILDASHAVTGYNGAARVTEYMYSSVDNRDDGTLSKFTPRTTITRIGSDSIGWTETSRRYHVEFLETDSNNTTRRVAITERAATPGAAYGASDSLRTTTYYNWRNANAGRPNLLIAEDGLATFYCYEFAVTNTAAGIVKNRVTESFTAPLSATNGIPYKTTVSRTISNLKGDVSREETWLVVEEGRELLSWTDYERDSAGRILRKESSNGDIEEAQWGCCGRDWTLDARGVLTEYSYDASKRRVSSSCGTVTTLWSYDLSGNATNITRYGISGTASALVASSSSGYDNAGRLAWTIGEDGVRTEYLYGVAEEGGEIRTTIRAAGTDCAVTNIVVSYRDGSTKATYLNGVLKETNINGPSSSITYEGTNGVSSARWTQSQTDFLGRTVSQSRPGFGGSTLVTSNLYDSVGRLCATSVSSATPNPSSSNLCVSALLRETIYLYNELGERVATIDDCDFDSAIDWSGPDVISSNATCYVCIDGDWWRESRSYAIQEDNSDEARLMSVQHVRLTGLGEDGLAAESVSIDQRGNATTNRVWRYRDDAMEITKTKYPTSIIPAMSIVSNSLAIMSVSQTGVTNTFAYDALNRQIAATDGRGNTTQTIYDANGRIVFSIDALGHATTYGYDALGRQTSITDPLTNTVYTAYDAEGRVLSQRGATYPVDYSYDQFGDKISMTTYRDLNGAGDTTRWLIDEATGLVTNKVYADGLGPSYTYTPDGKLATRTWARGIVTTYSYDTNGALTNTVYSDSTPTISLFYNRAGRQIEAHDAAGVTTFLYDDFGAVTNETVIGVAGTNTITRYWDEHGRSLGYSLNGTRQSTIGYDSVGRISSMLANGSDTPFTWNYLPNSDLKSSLSYPNGLTASWIYDANNQLLKVCNAFPTNIISQYDYIYDAAGCRTERYHSGFAFDHPDQIYYDYNNRSELTNAIASIDASYNFSYSYDNIGNRLWSLEDTNHVEYAANSLNQYTSISNLCDSASLRDEFIPQYDADGNQTLIKTSTGIWSATYNGENRPIYWSNGVTNIVMSFDRMGRRVTKNDQRFVYDGYLQIANFERASANSQLTTYNSQLFIWDPTEPVATRPLAWNCSTFQPFSFSTSFYVHDGNKNVSEIVAFDCSPTVHYEYAPFGAVSVQRGTSAASNPWRFSGEYADDDTATVYYNYRHYESVAGRWLRRDPEDERGGLNLYYICNCVNQTDVLGKNRYITQFDILNYGGSGGTQLHVGVAVDRWICRKGQWKKNGITTFDFSIDWEAPWYNFILGVVWKARGRIVSSPGLTLDAPITLKSCPSQDVKMFSMIKEEMKNPPFYNGAFHNCLFWSVGAINYGMSEKCNDCCKE